ncbi:MAG: serine/threonine protein kinase [Actinomycetota bacterium]|nr:serine/threonine protein kinase [Actinomycetota bacterium]
MEVGTRVGPYLLEEPLGEGAMGMVFRARREPEGEVVALKILRRELASDEVFKKRFAHEARAAGEVKNRHLVGILDAGEADGSPFLAIEYVEGQTLESRLQASGPLELNEVARIVTEVGSGLDALHRHELVHRDIKSANVMLKEDDTAMLTDFGLAKGRAYTVLTRAGQVMGTLDYMAPELVKGERATGASDIYALGCLAYECVTGAVPFAEKSIFQIGTAHLTEEPPDPSLARPDIPAPFAWALLQALAKEPAERPQTATLYGRMLKMAAA